MKCTQIEATCDVDVTHIILSWVKSETYKINGILITTNYAPVSQTSLERNDIAYIQVGSDSSYY